MLARKNIIQYVVLLSILFITGCQHTGNNEYTFRAACLSRLIEQCKMGGWNYATTDPTCVRAADEGIYSLTAAQLQSCQDAKDNDKKPSRQLS